MIDHQARLDLRLTVDDYAAVCALGFSNPNHWVEAITVGGAVSIVLARWRTRICEAFSLPDPWNAWPFASLRAIERALVLAPDFRKRRHESESRRRPSPLLKWLFDRGISVYVGLGWRATSPVILLAQCLPLQVGQMELVDCHD